MGKARTQFTRRKMENQSYKNHTRWVPLFHFGTFGGIIVLLVLSVIALATSTGETCWLSAWAVLASLLLALVAFFGRAFALRAQDRAIRAEESLRYFILTGKRIHQDLRLSQYIALRFASDDEFVALADRAAAEKLSPDAIKAAIKNWRIDRNRA